MRHSQYGDLDFLAIGVKVFVWALILGLLYLLRSFGLLIFLTFIFAYVQDLGVKRLERFIHSRTLRVVVTGLAFLGSFVIFGMVVVPRVREEVSTFTKNMPTYQRTIDKELLELADTYPTLRSLIPGLSDKTGNGDGEEHGQDDRAQDGVSPTAAAIEHLTGADEETRRAITQHVQEIGATLIGVTSSFLLAVLFSFLIVLDLPMLKEKARSLKETKLSFIYSEVAPSLIEFSKVMGQSLSAQFIIALFNTVFTAGIIYYLGLHNKIAFLSLLVFVCGMIPIAGVFISSAPILLIVLQDGGLGMVLVAALLIWVVHLIETYVLNPKIWGHHLHVNPVLVLIVLTVSGKLFGVWGLILGLPLAKYFFGYAIQREEALVAAPPASAVPAASH